MWEARNPYARTAQKSNGEWIFAVEIGGSTREAARVRRAPAGVPPGRPNQRSLATLLGNTGRCRVITHARRFRFHATWRAQLTRPREETTCRRRRYLRRKWRTSRRTAAERSLPTSKGMTACSRWLSEDDTTGHLPTRQMHPGRAPGRVCQQGGETLACLPACMLAETIRGCRYASNPRLQAVIPAEWNRALDRSFRAEIKVLRVLATPRL